MTPTTAPEYKGMLIAFLLESYLKALSDARFSVLERLDAITRLGLEIERLASFSAANNHQLAQALDQVFLWAADDADINPALDWYTDFLSGRDADWLRVVSSDRLSRRWKLVVDPTLRAKLLTTLLTLDIVNDPRRPENSVVRRLFADSEGINELGEPIGDCKMIAQVLLQRAVAAPHRMVLESPIQNVRNFSLRVLGFGIRAKFPRDQDLGRRIAIATAILAEVGELGTSKLEFEGLLIV